MNDGIWIAQAIAAKSRARRENAQQTRQRKRQITEDRNLTSEAKEAALEKLREEGYARHCRVVAEIERLQAQAEEYARLAREQVASRA
jgi:hypothetical protein